MQSLKAYKMLSQLSPTFHTQEAAAVWQCTPKQASKMLSRMAVHQLVVRLMQGRWSYTSSLDPLLLPNVLSHPMPCYISLYTALFFHGMIEQIPATTYAMTLGKTKAISTPLGDVSLHSIEPTLFEGFYEVGEGGIYIASPEKALFDTLYLAPARSNQFKRLTELSVPSHFNVKTAEGYIARVNHAGRRSLVQSNLTKALDGEVSR